MLDDQRVARHLAARAAARPGRPRGNRGCARLVASLVKREARAPHGDPGAVPDPALQRARRARRPARALPRRARSAPAALRAARRRVALRPPRPRRAQLRPRRPLARAQPRRLGRCGASGPTRSPSAAGTSPRSGSRSRTARTRRVPLLVWIESTARDARSRRVLELRDARWCARGAGAFVPGRRRPSTSRSLGVRARRDRAERDRRVDLRAAAVDRADRTRAARSSTSAGSIREKGLDTLLEAFRGRPRRARPRRLGSGGGTAARAAGASVRFDGPLDRDELVALLRRRRRVRPALPLRAVGHGAERGGALQADAARRRLGGAPAAHVHGRLHALLREPRRASTPRASRTRCSRSPAR